MTTIELTDQDAELFKVFCANRDTVETMALAGVFNVRSGSATLNFNVEGVLDTVNINLTAYKKGGKIVQNVRVL